MGLLGESKICPGLGVAGLGLSISELQTLAFARNIYGTAWALELELGWAGLDIFDRPLTSQKSKKGLVS